MFRLPHSEISRVAHTEYIGVKSHPFVKVDTNTQLHEEKQQAIDKIGDLKGKYETLRVEAKGQHERELAKILELNKTIKTQFQTIEQQDKIKTRETLNC